MNTLNKLRQKTLSNIEISELLGNRANIVTYPQLENYDTLDAAMGPYEALVILYETQKNFGHWTLIFKLNDNTVEFFDSYALKPDDELLFIPNTFRISNNEMVPYLSYLIYNSGYNIEYNDYKLQKKLKDINTCGRHVVSRLLFRDYDIDKYAKTIKDSGTSPDNFVTILTNFVSNNRI